VGMIFFYVALTKMIARFRWGFIELWTLKIRYRKAIFEIDI